jgi:D-glycero-D-manno-heptose 1,7-bisphosphate phosphatase
MENSMAGTNKAAFIDRDGVINEERGYVHRIEDFALLPRVPEALASLAASGFKLVVVTNQAGVARGYYDEAAVDRLHAHMRALLAESGVAIDAIYHCPHHPDAAVPAYRTACACRKPGDGMLRQAASDLQLDLSASVLVGDKASDIEAGQAAGVALTVLVESGHAIDEQDKRKADRVARDLYGAAGIITNNDIIRDTE